MDSFFRKELETHYNNKKGKYIVSFGIGTANSPKQEFDINWITNNIGQKLYKPKYYKVFFLIDCKYNEYIDEFKPNRLNTLINNYHDYDTNHNNFIEFKIYEKIKTLICDKFSIVIHIVPFNLQSSYKYDKFINNPKTLRDISACFQSEPDTLVWKYLTKLFKFYVHNPKSKLYINNNILTNTRFPFYNNKETYFLNITIGFRCEYTSEIIYILKKMILNDKYTCNIYFRNYLDYDSGYKIDEISKVNCFKNLSS